jgi:hypothetical protein
MMARLFASLDSNQIVWGWEQLSQGIAANR